MCCNIWVDDCLMPNMQRPILFTHTMHPIFYIDQSNAKEKPKRKIGVIESCPLWELSCVEVIDVVTVEVIEEEVVLKR